MKFKIVATIRSDKPLEILRIKKMDPVEIAGYSLVRLTIETDNVFKLCDKDDPFSFSKTKETSYEFEMTVPIPEACRYHAKDIAKLATNSFKWARSYGFDEKKSAIGIVAAGLSAFCYPALDLQSSQEKEYPKSLEFLNRYLSFLYLIDDRVDVLGIHIQDIKDDVQEKTAVFDRFISEVSTAGDIAHDQFDETKKNECIRIIQDTVRLYKTWNADTYSLDADREDKETLRKNLGQLIYGNDALPDEVDESDFSDFDDMLDHDLVPSSSVERAMSFQDGYSTEHAEQLCMLDLLAELLTLSPQMTPRLLQDWRNSFVDYIENITKEKEHELGIHTLNDAEQADVRKYVSGALHVLELFAAFRGIHLKEIEKVFPLLDAMKHIVSAHVGEINDCPLSTYKELADSLAELKQKNEEDARRGITSATQNMSDLSLLRHVLAQPKISILDRKIKEKIMEEIEGENLPEELRGYFFSMMDQGKIPYVAAKVTHSIDEIYQELLAKFDGYVSLFYQARRVVDFQLDSLQNNNQANVKKAYEIGLQFLTDKDYPRPKLSASDVTTMRDSFYSPGFLSGMDIEKTRKDIKALITVYEAWLTHPLAALKIPRYNVHLDFDIKTPGGIFAYANSFVTFADNIRKVAEKTTPEAVPTLETIAALPAVYIRTEPYSQTQEAVEARDFDALTALAQSNALYDDDEWGDDALAIAIKNHDTDMLTFLLERLHFNWLWKNSQYFSTAELENRPQTVFAINTGIYGDENLIGHVLTHGLARVEALFLNYIRSEFAKPEPQLPDLFFCDIRRQIPLAFQKGNPNYVYNAMIHFPPVACLDSLDRSADNTNHARDYDRYVLQASFIDAVKRNNTEAMHYLHAIGDIVTMSVESSVEIFNQIMTKQFGGPSNKVWTSQRIAAELFGDPDFDVTEECAYHVVILSDYLSATHQELRGVSTGDNSLCDAVIASFVQLKAHPDFDIEDHASLSDLNEAVQNGTARDYLNLKLAAPSESSQDEDMSDIDDMSESSNVTQRVTHFESINNKTHELAQSLNFPIRITHMSLADAHMNLADATNRLPDRFEIREIGDEFEAYEEQSRVGMCDEISRKDEDAYLYDDGDVDAFICDQTSIDDARVYYGRNDLGLFAERPQFYIHLVEINEHYLYAGPKQTQAVTDCDIPPYDDTSDGLKFQDIQKLYAKYYKTAAPENLQAFGHKLKLIQLLSFFAQYHKANYMMLRQLITEKMKKHGNTDMYLAFYKHTILRNDIYHRMGFRQEPEVPRELGDLIERALDDYQALKGQRLVNQYHGGFDCKTPLHYAVEKDGGDTVETLLALGASAYALDSDSHTPFSRACLNKNKDAALKLLPQRDGFGHRTLSAVPYENHFFKIIDKRGNTALHYACLSGSTDVVKLCLQDYSIQLMKAYSKEKPRLTLRELQKKHDVVPQDLNQGNLHGKSPLHLAASTKSIDGFSGEPGTLLEYLLERAPHESNESMAYAIPRPSEKYLSTKNETESLFDCVVYAGENDLMNYLWNKRYADVPTNLDYHKLLLKPKEDSEDFEVAGLFIRAINSWNLSTLKLVLDKYVACFKEICEQPISNAQKMSDMQALDIGDVLYQAVREGGLEIIDIVLRWKASVLPTCPELVAEVLTLELNVTGQNPRKEPLLFKAVSGGFLDVVQFLIQNGANLKTKFQGKDLLTHALDHGYHDVADYLREVMSRQVA